VVPARGETPVIEQLGRSCTTWVSTIAGFDSHVLHAGHAQRASQRSPDL